jgi:iron only hydrogenase large subunit-like protein/uncharacterized Fe-S cluster-containing protein
MIIETERTKCRDCYKCVRACPVKAIRVVRGRLVHELHATVVEDACIHDGTCLRECPQGAKRVREETHLVKAMLRSGDKVAVSLAPSFASSLPLDNPLRIVTAIRKLGVEIVQETALGAEMVARAHQKMMEVSDRPLISSSCPAVVSLIEMYHPEALEYLAPLVSPAIAHGKYLKRTYPGVKVVFVGPCVAKKAEIQRPDSKGAVDVALTFQELMKWLDEEGIDVESLPPGRFDGPRPGSARLFSADGGLLLTAHKDGLLRKETVAASGVPNCVEMIKHFIALERPPVLVELLACPGGCISGPFSLSRDDMFERRARLIAYAESQPEENGESPDYGAMVPMEELFREYADRKVVMRQPTEEELAEILERSGKFSPEDELNCGSCGYSSCREKAVAVFNGMADPEMCIPYMRQRAESMANVVVEASPNGVIVTSRGGTVIEVNQAAERILGVNRKQCIGQPIESFMDAAMFHEAAKTRGSVSGELTIGDLIIQQQTLYLPAQHLLVALLDDVTKERREAERQTHVVEEAVARAQQVIERQMSVAQKIAGLLGETTAETKLSLTGLMNVVREGKPGTHEPKG